jgi:hypothetical protein
MKSDMQYVKNSKSGLSKKSEPWTKGFSNVELIVEYFAAAKSTWLISEDIEKKILSKQRFTIRWKTSKVRKEPDTYGGTNWKNHYLAPNSNKMNYCGVHTQ